MTRKTIIKNGEVELPVTRSGNGRKLIFLNGAGATQVVWKKVIRELKGQYESITFDFRGHGKATTSDNYSFGAFMSDAETVLGAVDARDSIIVAWSMGADLAVSYAAAHPGALAGLVVVDGALPLPEGLVEDPDALRRSLNGPAEKLSRILVRPTPYRYRLSGDDIAALTKEVDDFRQHRMLDLYDNINCPITMLLATKTGGEKGAHAERVNRLWRKGAGYLAARHPEIPMQWVDSTHLLPLKKPAEVAKVVDEFAGQPAVVGRR